MSILEERKCPTIKIGIREEIRTLTVYPLSFSNARRLKNVILAIINGVNEMKETEGFDLPSIGAFVISIIEDNVIEIANMVLSEKIKEEELSLEQATELANHIYTMNAEGTIKNLSSLWKKFKIELPKAVTPQ